MRYLPVYIILGVAAASAAWVELPNSDRSYGFWRDHDCADFSDWHDAQRFYEAAGVGDPHGLDRDGDGIACERLKLH